MNFLGLGPGELFLILLLALIVFGPNKLPEMGANIGKAIREFRRASDQITQELNRELRVDLPPQEPMRTARAAAQPAPLLESPVDVEEPPEVWPPAEHAPDTMAEAVVPAVEPSAELESPVASEPVVESQAVVAAEPVVESQAVVAAHDQPSSTPVAQLESPPVEAATGEPSVEEISQAEKSVVGEPGAQVPENGTDSAIPDRNAIGGSFCQPETKGVE